MAQTSDWACGKTVIRTNTDGLLLEVVGESHPRFVCKRMGQAYGDASKTWPLHVATERREPFSFARWFEVEREFPDGCASSRLYPS